MSLCGNASLLFKFLLLHKNFPQKLIVYQTFRENDRNVAPNKQCSSKIENVKRVLLHLEAGGEPERLAGFSIYTTAFDMLFFLDMMSILTLTAKIDLFSRMG